MAQPLLTFDQALAHLRCEPDQVDASDLALKMSAAEQLACEHMGRSIYATPADLAAAVLDGTAGTGPMVCTDLMRAAMLLILGHLWANREDVVTGTTSTALDQGSRALLATYRSGMGV